MTDTASKDNAELQAQAIALTTRELPLAIKSEDEYRLISEDLKVTLDFISAARTHFDPKVKRLWDAHKAECDDRTAVIGPAQNRADVARRILGDYKDAEDRRLAAERMLLQQKADEEAAEKKRLEDAERAKVLAKLQLENAAKIEAAEEARKALYADGQRKRASEMKAEAERIAAETKAQEAEAERLRHMPVPQAAPVVAPAPVKVQGQSTRIVWDVYVEDEDKVPIRYRPVGEDALAIIRPIVNSLGAEHGIPGIRAVKRTVVVQRKR